MRFCCTSIKHGIFVGLKREFSFNIILYYIVGIYSLRVDNNNNNNIILVLPRSKQN